ncbi:MAG: DNRLRE domain-containing protein [Anaerolineae bacterium]
MTWNNFGGSFVDATEGYLVSQGAGFHAVDLTHLVRHWVNGSAANYGVLLEQNVNTYDAYKSSEYGGVIYRPVLQVCYHAAP